MIFCCLSLAALFAISSGCLVWVIVASGDKPTPKPEPDEIDEVNRMIGYAKHLREQQEATAAAFIDLHDPTSNFEIDELYDVIVNRPSSADYAASMVRIMHEKFPHQSAFEGHD